MLTSGDPVHPRLADAWDRLPRWDSMDRRSLARQRFRPGGANQQYGTASVPGARHSIPEAP